ncbi:hypothetical protein AABB24_009587, partial [Solanum stoloniferum]
YSLHLFSLVPHLSTFVGEVANTKRRGATFFLPSPSLFPHLSSLLLLRFLFSSRQAERPHSNRRQQQDQQHRESNRRKTRGCHPLPPPLRPAARRTKPSASISESKAAAPSILAATPTSEDDSD